MGLARGLWVAATLFATFVVVGAAIEIKATRDAWSWEPRKARITQHEIVHGYSSESGADYSRISLLDLVDGQKTSNVQARFGSWSSAASRNADAARFPAGKEVTAFRDPHNLQRYVLEQNSIWYLATLEAIALAWLCWVAFCWTRRRWEFRRLSELATAANRPS